MGAKTIEEKLGRLAKQSVKSAFKVQGKVHKKLDAQAGDGWLPPKASFSEVAAKKKLADVKRATETAEQRERDAKDKVREMSEQARDTKQKAQDAVREETVRA